MGKDKKMIKREILEKFRSISPEEDYILPPQWLESDYMPGLTTYERKILKQAINELISLGLIENVKGSRLNLKLTEKGANLLS